MRLWTLPVLALACGAVLSAHLKVEKTAPAAGSVVSAAPKTIQLWFSEAPTLAVTAITLTAPSGIKVSLGKPAVGKAGDSPYWSVMADVLDTLASGEYTVAWRTSGRDGHTLTGTFTFTLKTL